MKFKTVEQLSALTEMYNYSTYFCLVAFLNGGWKTWTELYKSKEEMSMIP